MNPNLVIALNNLLPWLQTNLGVSNAVRYRSKFEGAFKIELINRLQLLGVHAVPEQDRVDISWSTDRGKILLELKTINTNFQDPHCIRLTRPITKNISDLLSDIRVLETKDCFEAYVSFIVFPCSLAVQNWDYHFRRILPHVIDYQLTEFVFANQARGLMYVAKIKESTGIQEISQQPVADGPTPTLINFNMETKEASKNQQTAHKISNNDRRNMVPFRRGTYLELLQEISRKLEAEEKIISIAELEEEFEKQFLIEMKRQNPGAIESDLNDWLITFRNGAKSAQIILNTVNNKNRIHFRPTLNPISEFNNFIILNIDDKAKYYEKMVTGFSPSRHKNFEIFYSKTKGSLDSITVQEAYK